ncbi:hypothetical protein FQN49_006532 [Arthroderma sp. PD_2]|nr:hypothetical protein FQN49_006532 [Arthroderma sp. PD_2]
MRLLPLFVAALPLASALPPPKNKEVTIVKDAAGNTLRVPELVCTRPEGLNEIKSIQLSPWVIQCYLYSDADCTNGKIVEFVKKSTDQVKHPEAASIECDVTPKSKPGGDFRHGQGKGQGMDKRELEGGVPVTLNELLGIRPGSRSQEKGQGVDKRELERKNNGLGGVSNMIGGLLGGKRPKSPQSQGKGEGMDKREDEKKEEEVSGSGSNLLGGVLDLDNVLGSL